MKLHRARRKRCHNIEIVYFAFFSVRRLNGGTPRSNCYEIDIHCTSLSLLFVQFANESLLIHTKSTASKQNCMLKLQLF